MMKSLIIDTSSAYCLLAVIEDGKVLAHTLFLHDNRLSNTLLTEIAALLKDNGLTLQQIEQIAFGVGPGSYTGTRVGAIVARTLAYGLNLPIRGFCSLAAFLPPAIGTFAAVLPAKSGLFFLLAGEKREYTLQTARAELISADELGKILPTVNFATARSREDLPHIDIINFSPFHPDPQNIAHALQSPPVFSFEKEGSLIYLNPVKSGSI
jgi:tRNA threonylcarbamoyladenosine biosynthesis protein TsaB